MVENAIYIINGLVSGIAITVVGGAGFVWAKISNLKAQHDRLYDNLHAKYTFTDSENVQLSADYKQLKQDFQQLADEHQKEAQKYDDLFLKHEELKEKYAPFATLDPFSTQAMQAVTQQSIMDEWMNGPREEVKNG